MRERRQAWYPTFLSWMNKMEDGEGGRLEEVHIWGSILVTVNLNASCTFKQEWRVNNSIDKSRAQERVGD